MLRRFTIACLWLLAVAAAAQTAINPSGIHVLGSESALVWENGGTETQSGTFRMWRVDMAPVVSWKPVAVPPALESFDESSDNPVRVTFDQNILRLFWVTTQECVKGSEDPECFLNDVYQVESHDDGSTWQVYVSRFQVGGPPMDGVKYAAMADSMHGWMLLAGDAGTGSVEEMLATTSDGGIHWTKSKALGMPIGRNSPQLLFVRSATEAWFASLHFEKDNPLVMAHTTDSGQTWTTNTSFPQSYPWCIGCMAGGLTTADDRPHPEQVCFEARLGTDVSGSSESLRGHAQYCLLPDGRSWSEPERILQSDLQRYADSQLGFAETCAEAECQVHQTLDAGKSWQVASKVPPLSGMHLNQVEASGNHVWLLMSLVTDKRQARLCYSPDHGLHWTVVSTPH